MTLNRLRIRVSVFWHQQDLIRAQSKLIRLLKQQRNEMALHQTRELHELVGAFLICLETPEIDVRDELAAMEQALGERLAVLEEHIL